MPTLRAPAKINLTLEILARRDDGYHALRSVMVPVGLYDEIDVAPGTGSFVTSDPTLSADNLVQRALAASGAAGPFDVTLVKRIPVGGGLGGGSSDAAAVLRAAMAGELGARPERDWIAVARALGSDVPFFLTGTAGLVEGTGERVTALGSLPAWWTVIVRPRAFVATADAYRRLDAARAGGAASRPRSTSGSLDAVDALQRRDFAATAAALQNDFHDVVLAAYPEVARSHAALGAAGARHALLSGSGSCCFALAEHEADAREIAARFDAAAADAVFVAPFHRDGAWS